MPDIELTKTRGIFWARILDRNPRRPTWFFLAGKRCADILISVLLLPVLAGLAIMLLVLNPFLNRGPLIFLQIRMGHGYKPFVVYKFRSMVPRHWSARRPDDPLETGCITVLGCILRRSRIDELPQILNVLKGEMSLIGPRPDCVHHARYFGRRIPGYRARYRVRPGISGLAQTEIGYAQGIETVMAKIRADNRYINNMGLVQELRIFWRTVLTVLGLKGV